MKSETNDYAPAGITMTDVGQNILDYLLKDFDGQVSLQLKNEKASAAGNTRRA